MRVPKRSAFPCACVGIALILSVLGLSLPAVGQDTTTDSPAVEETSPTAAIDTAAAPEDLNEPTVDAEDEIIGSVSLVERLEQGGKTMLFLLFLSIIAVTTALERVVRLRRGAIAPTGLAAQAQTLWSEGKETELLKLCSRTSSTLSTIIDAFVRHKHCSSQELSMLAGDLAGRDMRRHLQRAYPIAIVATLSPLLGLLGTVVGMIESFEIVAIAGSLGDASLLAGGISKALVTTATGLVIAVPALGLYHFFRSRTQTLTMVLEGDVHELLTSWFMDVPTRGDAESEG
ncbi:MAG: MotA/TolQ/ExbB proton channel family protein [Lentisphaerae bacterium]|jgi:biopolymer transport protein ExbB|nr:MotA/TolQ/ExbB proton channel family protein [Lentisphaerota bacterium]MBT5606236.1 MotA/TolQ/ExbB proton channel family protein [Lentisphaerota bacterium]MBT7054311.1 MotA/TolQ/ExbB proton channel family protein [Lentisphaerota bacterium]MBT7843302.1 MotA/TolQ/ExbB proton channel family protein [Lentisphaerota bacterium]